MTTKHRHAYRPALALGHNRSGSAKWWVCDCGRRIEFKDDYAVTIGAHR